MAASGGAAYGGSLMTIRLAAPHRRARPVLAALLSLVVLAGLPVGAAAVDPAPAAADFPAASPAPAAAPAPVGAPPPDLRPFQVDPGDAPSQMYLDTVANEDRAYAFTPGGRVTVPFEPRVDDRWSVGGSAPRPLPAGRESGAEMAAAAAAPAAPEPAPPDMTSPAPPDGGAAAPSTLAAATPATAPIRAVGASLRVPSDAAPAAPAAVGMRREVYGYLPYWEVSDASTRLDFSVLTHVAYFSVGVDAKGDLRKRESDGSLTTGWAGWTSSKMTAIIDAAHRQRSRVTLTLTAFAWTSSQAAVQEALLGSSSARRSLARQAAAAVRDRGADGINLDFEPLVAGSEDGFVALVRAIRAELDQVAPGYHLSFATLGYPGNYPLEAALAPGGADAVFVMGYDYRTAGSNYAGSIDPLGGPAYDLADTIRAYTLRVPASRVILGVPYYGRAWSTVSDDVNARTQTGAKYGYSAAVPYDIAADYAAEHGRRYDGREVSAWVAYRKQSCTSTYGCVTTWRQLYYDDTATLGARYDLVNRAGLRGAGIWALGYDGTRRELYATLAAKFLRDSTPPQAGIVGFAGADQRSEGFVVRWTAADDWSGVANYDVQVSVDGGTWANWLLATKATSATWLGLDNRGYAFRVRARDGKGNASAWNVTSLWTAAASLAPGGFLEVTGDSLNVRAAPDTSATRLATAARGDLFAVTGGPTAADGYTWYQVSGPLTTWGPVSDIVYSAWVAVTGPGVTNAVAAPAPNATRVQAGIRWVTFGGAGAESLGTSRVAVASRSFSPNGDGSGDLLAIRWSNRHALDSLALQVLRPDGTALGSVPLSATEAGTREYGWDGTVGGAALPDGSYVLQLAGTSGATTFMWPADDPMAGDLPARLGVTIDRVAPTLESAKATGTRLSPNGDGAWDALRVAGTGSADVVRWDVLIAPVVGGAPGDPVRRIAGSGGTASAYWNGTADDGTRVPDGTYRVTLRLFDAAGNPAQRSWTAVVDTTPPALAAAAAPGPFSPDGDGTADRVRLAWSASEAASGTLRVLRGTTIVRSWTIVGTSGAVTWDGRDLRGRVVADGRYTVSLTGADALANRGTTTAPLVVDRTAGSLRWSPTAFYAEDGDRLAPTATVSVRLGRAARVTLRILDASGAEVRVAWRERATAAGTASWRWDGRAAGGAFAPAGRYVAELTAVSWLGTTVLRRPVVVGAFDAALSSSAPAAGTRLTVTFRSVEPLAAPPTATFRQPGRDPVRMTVARVSASTWRATVTVAEGAPGPATISLLARDTGGGKNRLTLHLAVR